MDPDFTALASRVAARAEVLGCVILSRDGLVLGAFPPHGEHDITPGLLRFAALGDPDRGFAQFADELWAYVREGSYAAFAVAEKGTRPGILLDYLEQALLVAEESRQFGVAMAEPVHVDLSQKGMNLGRRLRASMADAADDFRAAVVAPEHEGRPAPPQELAPVVPAVDDSALDEALAAAVAAGDRSDGGRLDQFPHTGDPAAEVEAQAAAQEPEPRYLAEGYGDPGRESWQDQGSQPDQGERQPHQPDPAGHIEPAPPQEPTHEPSPDVQPPPAPASPDEIDRVALAREFAQLLQEAPGGAE